MSDPTSPPGSSGGRRKRPPTVIDLDATEVPPQAAAETPAPQQQAEEARVQPSAEQQASATSAEQAAFEPPPSPEPPSPEPPRAPEPESEAPRAAAKADETAKPVVSWMQPAMAGSAGAAGGLVLVLLLWVFGVFSGGRDASPELGSRLASIEQQLKSMAARPSPAVVDPKAFDEIAGRLTRLEAAQSSPRAPVTDPVVLGRLTAAENAAKSQADNLAAGSRRDEALEAALRESNARVAKLNADIAALQERAKETAAGSDRASRLAVASAALRAAVERGDPFQGELAIVKPLASDTAAIAALEPFATSGVPGAAALGQELAAVVRPMLRAAGAPSRDGGFLDKLQANAEKLVRIRPVDDASGDDRAAILTRIEQRAVQGNLAGALAELGKLPPAARAPAQAWIAKAEARNKAIDAGRKLAADAVAALKVSP